MESIAIEDKVKGYDKGLLKISHLSYFGIFPKKKGFWLLTFVK